ncbi:unnamed protein product [Prorocentrum cordatum]|uniref:Uncharacterized protein n=1 Tax=Prorocentrum cordatum TaxID=2364126 RepID=A0ABN9Y3Q9_9DINO|nr:unnamed protein product [Polarella glacialis]
MLPCWQKGRRGQAAASMEASPSPQRAPDVSASAARPRSRVGGGYQLDQRGRALNASSPGVSSSIALTLRPGSDCTSELLRLFARLTRYASEGDVDRAAEHLSSSGFQAIAEELRARQTAATSGFGDVGHDPGDRICFEPDHDFVHWVAERKADPDARSTCVLCGENGSMGVWFGVAAAERCGGTCLGTSMSTSVGSSARKEQRRDPFEESSVRRHASAPSGSMAVACTGRRAPAPSPYQTTPSRAAARPSSASPAGEKPWTPNGVPSRLSTSVPQRRAARASSAGGARPRAEPPCPRRAPRPTSLRW